MKQPRRTYSIPSAVVRNPPEPRASPRSYGPIAQAVSEALSDLINLGSFHGSDVPLCMGIADGTVFAEAAIRKVAALGWITQGNYDPTPEQRCTLGRKAERLQREHRNTLMHHWITTTTKYLKPADVAAVLG